MTETESKVPDWVIFPEDEWVMVTPSQAGFDVARLNEITSQVRAAAFEGEVHGENEWGAVLARGGYIVQTWGNPDYRFQTASVGKAFTRVVLGLAVEESLIDPDDPIHETWTGKDILWSLPSSNSSLRKQMKSTVEYREPS